MSQYYCRLGAQGPLLGRTQSESRPTEVLKSCKGNTGAGVGGEMFLLKHQGRFPSGGVFEGLEGLIKQRDM